MRTDILLFALLFSVVSHAAAGLAQTTTMPNPFSDGSKSPPSAHTVTPERASPPERANPAPQAAKAGQFSSEAEAKSHCPGDIVVWVNTGTGVYHYPGAAAYGNTKRGAFMCERDTSAAGMRAAKNEKHP